MRFAIVSFVFLFWAFYELSGGADFEPRGRRPTPQADLAADRAAPVVEKVAARPAIAPRKPHPRTADVPSAQESPVSEPAADPPQTAPHKPPRLAASVGAGLSLFPPVAGNASLAASGGPIPSLATIAARPASQTETSTTTVTPDTTPTEPDIREIIGTRVNMRDGPGTIYPATARLMLGQKVEVLEDSGTGWLRLKTVQSGLRGWVAASLVSKPAR
ncbi:SH3 domain-containing protein [Jhaorihella thermophila]|uniref:SH3 domain-containing protein n=1 Tax=Jhaorihella thermophila TaxID=488547 RepID=A0A1H5V9R1_9RHOB|nr:SH3 domain-containing protein [Jhaorihella thermophila]SEF83187.1 SH3 domain-containing protein [Jhaorihella thermophila]